MLSLSQLVRYIIDTHHAFLRNDLPALKEQVAGLCADHRQNRPELFTLQQGLQDLRDDVTSHLAKEENVLFPHMVELGRCQTARLPPPPACFPGVQVPIRIRMMRMEHGGAEALLSNLSVTTCGDTPPAEFRGGEKEIYRRLAILEADLKGHIQIVNDILFPKAIELEGMSQWN
jgi:regulator of cell morphogenesis and NO signaling